MDYLVFDTPIGPVGLEAEGDKAVTRLYFPNQRPDGRVQRETPLLAEARRQLLEYFAGGRAAFALPLRLDGTPFQRRVWNMLAAIPYGRTRTYGDLAADAGAPGAARAVGGACHRNPIPILIPCHRVIGAGGSLTGFGGGLKCKKALLNLERAVISV